MVKSGKGKPSFDGVKTMYLEVKADQANLSYVSDFIKRKLGEEYAIVNNEGIELEDSPVTQGQCIIFTMFLPFTKVLGV